MMTQTIHLHSIAACRSLVRAIALLFQHQRPLKTVTHGEKVLEYLEVEPADIALANEIAGHVLGRTLEDLAPKTRRFLSALDTMVTAIAKESGLERSAVRFGRREISARTGYSYDAMRPLLARLVSLVCFVAAFALVARRARVGWLGAAFGFSFFPIVFFGSAGRPDSVALLLATVAFARTLRRRVVDVLAAALFATAVFVKPNIMGLAAGSLVVFTLAHPRAAVRPILAGLATAIEVE